MAVRMSAPFCAASLLVWLPAFAQTGECRAPGATDGGATGEAEDCPDPHGPLTPDTRGLDSNWEDIQLDQRLDRMGVHPSDGSEPLDGNANETRATRGPQRESTPPSTPECTRTDCDAILTVELETIAGQAQSAPIVSSLTTLRFHLPEEMGLGLIVPFSFGVQPEANCLGDMCHPLIPRHAFIELNNAALFATWEHSLGPNTRTLVELLLATGLVTGMPWEDDRGHRLLFAPLMRSFEDLEFFYPVVLAIVPKVGLFHAAGRVDVTTTLKFPVLVPAEIFLAVGTLQVMVRLVDTPRTRVSAGIRAVGAGWTGTRTIIPGETLLSGAVEPRAEARFGALELRVGFLVSLAYRTDRTELGYREFDHFPDTWGLRVGVGYSF